MSAEVTVLAFPPEHSAIALSVVVLEMEIALLYTVEVFVGVLPLVV